MFSNNIQVLTDKEANLSTVYVTFYEFLLIIICFLDKYIKTFFKTKWFTDTTWGKSMWRKYKKN